MQPNPMNYQRRLPSRVDGAGRWIPVIVSAAGFVCLPPLEVVSFYLPLFSMIQKRSDIQLGQFSVFGLAVAVLSVAAPIVAAVFYARCRRRSRSVYPSQIGFAMGAVLVLCMVILYLSAHSNLINSW